MTLLSLAALASGAGCGDDDPSSSPASKGGSVGSGKGGSGGSSGSTSKGGTNGDAGGGGEDAVGGEGGVGGGSAGQGGGAPEEFAPIATVFDELYDEVHDLRGLTFAANGKIYASGYRGATYGTGATAVVPQDRELVVVRFNADGALDDTFDDDGIAVFNLVERQTEIVGAGGAGGAGGSGGEEVIINDGNEDSIGLVELENEDLIVQVHLRGESGAGQDVGLFKLDNTGAPVAAFGNDRAIDGLNVIDFGWSDGANPSASDTAWGVELDTSGDEERVVLSGFGPAKLGELDAALVQRTDNDRYIVRLMADDASIDPAFNGGEVFSYNSLGTFAENARRPLVEADGAILSAGYTNFGAGLGNHIMLIRLLPDGTLDPDFGFGIVGDGVARANPFVDDGGAAECYAIAKQESGRYVTTGYGEATGVNVTSSFGFATSTAQDLVSFGVLPGSIDPTYGVQGAMAIQSEEANLTGTEDRGRDLLILPDQRIVQVGRFGDAPAVFVQLPDGQLDTSVGTMGRFMYEALDFAATNDLPAVGTSHFFNVALSPDGARIAATTNNHPNGVRLAILEVDE